MALALCPDCGNPCSLKAYSCPKCGRPFDENELASSKQLISLSQFISDNKDLLTAASVLTALSLFWNNANVKPLGSFLSFLCLIATVPILFEIWNKHDASKATWLNLLFINVFSLLLGYTVWYLLVDFRPQWQTEMEKVVTWTIFIPLWIIYRFIDKPKQLRKFGRYAERKLSSQNRLVRLIRGANQRYHEDTETGRKVQTFFGHTIAFLMLLLLCGALADVLSPLINRRLDKVYQEYKLETASPSPSVTPTNQPSPTPSPP